VSFPPKRSIRRFIDREYASVQFPMVALPEYEDGEPFRVDVHNRLFDE